MCEQLKIQCGQQKGEVLRVMRYGYMVYGQHKFEGIENEVPGDVISVPATPIPFIKSIYFCVNILITFLGLCINNM